MKLADHSTAQVPWFRLAHRLPGVIDPARDSVSRRELRSTCLRARRLTLNVQLLAQQSVGTAESPPDRPFRTAERTGMLGDDAIVEIDLRQCRLQIDRKRIDCFVEGVEVGRICPCPTPSLQFAPTAQSLFNLADACHRATPPTRHMPQRELRGEVGGGCTTHDGKRGSCTRADRKAARRQNVNGARIDKVTPGVSGVRPAPMEKLSEVRSFRR